MSEKLVANGTLQWNAADELLVLPEQLTIDVLAGLLKTQNWLSLPVKQVDFSQVLKADSAILAVLLTWAAHSEERLTIIKLPDELQTLVKLYDLDGEFHFI
ncbi:hypothetical protein THMIRHAM_05840 [Thiomicrorhabdus immobilis]|uniref:MlaB-like STAS domain-containing protein n=1 Tax=Thiomicrorhabdus immobilis TaxID=2791037 RepID=A0ABM7MBS8_9GAMM|nr:STAS domain-containing protein [Thiomicrorhabdus immobilis]BCN92799.1 hypothetical protein THMIRHAM_05840 [Thiomicrorhabdus immobilis]